MLRAVLWAVDARGNVWLDSSENGAPLGWGTLDDHGALIVWEMLSWQIGETGGETSREVAEWRREHELALD